MARTTFRSDIQNAQTTTPPRARLSVRRTSHVDMTIVDDGLLIDGRCRDLTTGAETTVRGEATVHASLSPMLQGSVIGELTVTPENPAIAPLIGLTAVKGFRAAVVHALPDEHRDATPLFMLLDELPVATLISGFARIYSGNLPAAAGTSQADICSGWASDGLMITEIRRTGEMPIPLGPPAPELRPSDDPLAWHELGPVPEGGMRRRRLVEVSVGEQLDVFAMFRDSHVPVGAEESVLHEYSLRATVDPRSHVITSCVATPQVLPWNECPSAAASASRLVGHSVNELRDLVAKEFKGIGTCTHLNDLLRSLGDLRALITRIPAS